MPDPLRRISAVSFSMMAGVLLFQLLLILSYSILSTVDEGALSDVVAGEDAGDWLGGVAVIVAGAGFILSRTTCSAMAFRSFHKELCAHDKTGVTETSKPTMQDATHTFLLEGTITTP